MGGDTGWIRGARSRPLRAVLALALGASLQPPPPLNAQEAKVLTLEEALERAALYNPDYRIAQNDLELSRTGRREAWGAFLPNLSLSASTGLSFDRQLVSTDFFGNPVENPFTEWRTTSNSSQYLGGSIAIFEGGTRFHELAAEGARAEAREATVTTRLRTLRSEVVRTYYQAQSQQAFLAVEEELLEGRLLDLELTQRMFDLAGATRVDVLAAELDVQRQEQRIQQIRAQSQQALLTLKRMVGDPDLEAIVLADGLPVPFDPSRLDPEALVPQALASNPQVLEQEAQLLVGEAQAKVARGSRWPTLSLSFGFNQRTFADERGALFDLYPDQGRFGSTSVSLTLPIFSRFQTQARVAEAQVAMDNSRENLRRTRLQIEEQVRSRIIALQTASRSYEIALRSREIAQERVGLAREQFRFAARSFTELQQDIEAAAQAERDVITQLFGFMEAQANLEEVAGQFVVDESSSGAAGGQVPGGDRSSVHPEG
jgi:outer membrane protein TolC